MLCFRGWESICRLLQSANERSDGNPGNPGKRAYVNGFDVTNQPNNVRQSISRQVADTLLNRFGLTDAADRKVSTYSGGMRRRLDIAMSLVGNPPLIFLDEPTTGLDPEVRIEFWQIVRELAEGGTTVFLTTQYLEEAEQLADRIAILHEGRIIANGTLAELKKLFPPTKVEYIEKQPTLEEIFLAIINKKGETQHGSDQ